MFKEVEKTVHPPDGKPLMVWDGNCGFCHYWIIRWKKMTRGTVRYEKYQDVGKEFPDIPVERFREAVRLIEPSGKVYSGPEAAYRSFTYVKSPWRRLYVFYRSSKFFRKSSNWVYQWIAGHRSFMYDLSVFLFGRNPAKPYPYWVIYLLAVALMALLFVIFT